MSTISMDSHNFHVMVNTFAGLQLCHFPLPCSSTYYLTFLSIHVSSDREQTWMLGSSLSKWWSLFHPPLECNKAEMQRKLTWLRGALERGWFKAYQELGLTARWHCLAHGWGPLLALLVRTRAILQFSWWHSSKAPFFSENKEFHICTPYYPNMGSNHLTDSLQRLDFFVKNACFESAGASLIAWLKKSRESYGWYWLINGLGRCLGRMKCRRLSGNRHAMKSPKAKLESSHLSRFWFEPLR